MRKTKLQASDFNPRAHHLHEEDEAAGVRVEEALPVDNLVEAAHGGGALQQDGVDAVGEAVAGHCPRDGLLRWEAVQNLQTWILTSGLETGFAPSVLQDQFRSITIFASETSSRDRFLQWEAVQNLQTWILTSGFWIDFAPLVLQDRIQSITILASETSSRDGLLWWEAVQNLQTWILASCLRTGFAPSVRTNSNP
jgi:hypothetical protein